MGSDLKLMFHIILIIVPLSAKVTQSTYKQVISVEGEIIGQFTVRSRTECALRCLDDCTGYKWSQSQNCLTIEASNGGQTFISNNVKVIYKKDLCAETLCKNGGTCVEGTCLCLSGFAGHDCTESDVCEPDPCFNGGTCVSLVDTFTCQCDTNYDGETCRINCNEPWITPDRWTAGAAGFYRSFESTTGMLMNNGAVLGSGKVCTSAAAVVKSLGQWIDLGDVAAEGCIVKPETCSSGGTMAYWMRTQADTGGVLASRTNGGTSGLEIVESSPTKIEYEVIGDASRFAASVTRDTTEWTHVVLVYHGPNNGQGITVYYNGALVSHDAVPENEVNGSGSGKLVIGRQYVLSGSGCSVEIDDLLMWDEALTPEDVDKLFGYYLD